MLSSASRAEVNITSPTFSFVSARHASEGSIVRLRSSIVHIFRLAVNDGGHVSNDGSLAIRYSADDGLTWSKSKVVMQHPFDVRNIRCSLVTSKIICFFRLYDAEKQQPVSLSYTVSSDGESWSNPHAVPDIPRLNDFYEMWIDNPISVQGRFLFTVHAVGYIEVFQAELDNEELLNISSLKLFDYRDDSHLNGIDEPELTFLPNGEAIVLYRDENDSNTGAFLASVGVSGIGDLNAPEPTDICASENAKAVAPHIITATGPSSFLGIGTTRNRNPASGSKDEICIFEVVVDEKGDLRVVWQATRDRPYPSDFRFYGYPVSVPVGDSGLHLIVFTDAYLDTRGVEVADLFQLYISSQAHKPSSTILPLVELTHPDTLTASDGTQHQLKNIISLQTHETLSVARTNGEFLINLQHDHRDRILRDSFDQFISYLLGADASNQIFLGVADFNGDEKLTGGDALGVLRVKRDVDEPALLISKDGVLHERLFSIDRPEEFFSLEENMQLRLIGDIGENYMVQQEFVCPRLLGSSRIFVDAESDYSVSFPLSRETPHLLELRDNESLDGLFELTVANSLKYVGGGQPSSPLSYSVSLSLVSEGCKSSRSFLVTIVASDLDYDGLLNRSDSDMDGDGVHNAIDKFPFDAGEYSDQDSDGIGDNTDTDLDNDGIPNWFDPDMDGDGDLNEVDLDPRNRFV